MGNPRNYSLDLPARCLSLVEKLWPHVQDLFVENRRDLGPLTSTFLLSMSMPILNLPLERIGYKIGDERYVNDRELSPNAADEIDKVLRKGTFGKAEFFVQGVWRFINLDTPPFPNISHGLPDYIAVRLDTEEGVSNAANMQTELWCSVLRNALAHGGILYLDAEGRSSYQGPVKMYAFVSGKYDEGVPRGRKPLKGVRILRISEEDFRDFLVRWVSWLQRSGLLDELNAA